MLREVTTTFVWRCPACSGTYGGESLPFLYTDGDHGYCPCGGRLIEDVAAQGKRHYRLVVPEPLRGTALHRQLEDLVADEDDVEVAFGGRGDHYINFFSCE